MTRTYNSEKIKRVTNHYSKAASFMIQSFQDEDSYQDIADALNKAGYVNIKNKEVTQGDVSSFLISKGYRRGSAHKNKRNAHKPSVAAKEPRSATKTHHSKDDLLKDAEDLLTSNLSDELKSRFLRKLIA